MSTHPQKTTGELVQEQTIEHRPSGELRWSRSATALNPYPWYLNMRTSDPVHYNEESKMWEVFRYDDVLAIISDYTTFSSERVMRNRNKDGEEPARTLLNTDPPRHRQLRSIITQAFTPRAIAQLTPRITEIANEYLDRVAPLGRMDVVVDLAYPLPVIVIAEMLGIPPEERDQFRRWSDAIVSTAQEEAMQAAREMNEYFKGIIEEHRKHPREDLISALISAEVEGEHLSEAELLSFCILLLVAGNETTTNLIGNAFICFDEHPETMDELRAEPALVPGAIEEVLRYLSPVQLLIRSTTVDTVIAGQPIKAGEIVVPCLGSANRDEAQFPQPDTFDIRRTPNRHVAFGHGIHFCIGAPLARLEARVALEIMFTRFTNIKRVKETPLEPIPSAFVFGVKHLPITFIGLRVREPGQAG